MEVDFYVEVGKKEKKKFNFVYNSYKWTQTAMSKKEKRKRNSLTSFMTHKWTQTSMSKQEKRKRKRLTRFKQGGPEVIYHKRYLIITDDELLMIPFTSFIDLVI